METIFQNVAGNCLTDAELQAFRAGRVSGAAIEQRVAEHLGSCRSCESRLELLADLEQGILALLRAPDPFESLAEAESRSISSASTNTFEFEQRTPPSVGEREALPEKIGKYFVLDWIARGGFGNVYKAKDPEANRIVAIKVPRLRSSKSVAQFLAEARTAGQLTHPWIVQVYDCRLQDDGTCYVVMQYIEGRSLRDILKSEKIEQRRAALWIAKIASALQYAHSRNIYHRDVKPENILLDHSDQPYLTDFGLAIRDEQRWDHEGEAAGTVAYMSPEQVRGESQFIDGRTDIWGLGVVFYEMLTRQKPFSGNTRKALHDEIQRRDPRAPRSINPSVSKSYEAVCLKCLEKRITDRYATAADVAARLRKIVARRMRIAVGATLLICALVAPFWLAVDRWKTGTGGGPRDWPSLAKEAHDEPYDLFDREPRSLVVPSLTEQSLEPLSAVFDSRRHTFSIQSSTPCLYTFGDSPQARYLIRTGIQKSSQIGAHGLFFGFRPLESSTPSNESLQNAEGELWTCHAVILNCVSKGQDEVTRLERQRLTFERVENHFHLVELDHAAAVSVTPPGAGTGLLEVRIHAQMVELVRWNGAEQKELVTALGDALDPKWSCEGEFGLMTYYGSVMFSDGRIVFD